MTHNLTGFVATTCREGSCAILGAEQNGRRVQNLEEVRRSVERREERAEPCRSYVHPC